MADPEKVKIALENGRNANLRGAELQGAELANADLEDADLRMANLTNANLTNANLEGADLQMAILRSAKLPGATLQGAKLLGARLQGAKLRRADLEGADLRRANLEDADLRMAILEGVDLPSSKNLNLLNASGYVLNGQDTSTWSISPVSIFRGYSDPWSKIRLSYTGVMTAFHLLFGLVALGPYLIRAIVFPYKNTAVKFDPNGIPVGVDTVPYDMPRVLVALGCGEEYAWFLVPSAIVLITYNGLRLGMTWWLSQLRDEEVRTGHAPMKSQYWPSWLVHKYFMFWAAMFALLLGSIRTCYWLFEWV